MRVMPLKSGAETQARGIPASSFQVDDAHFRTLLSVIDFEFYHVWRIFERRVHFFEQLVKGGVLDEFEVQMGRRLRTKYQASSRDSLSSGPLYDRLSHQGSNAGLDASHSQRQCPRFKGSSEVTPIL